MLNVRNRSRRPDWTSPVSRKRRKWIDSLPGLSPVRSWSSGTVTSETVNSAPRYSPRGLRTGEPQERPVPQRNGGGEVVVLMTALFPMNKACRDEAVQMVRGLPPRHPRLPLNLATTETR